MQSTPNKHFSELKSDLLQKFHILPFFISLASWSIIFGLFNNWRIGWMSTSWFLDLVAYPFLVTIPHSSLSAYINKFIFSIVLFCDWEKRILIIINKANEVIPCLSIWVLKARGTFWSACLYNPTCTLISSITWAVKKFTIGFILSATFILFTISLHTWLATSLTAFGNNSSCSQFTLARNCGNSLSYQEYT